MNRDLSFVDWVEILLFWWHHDDWTREWSRATTTYDVVQSKNCCYRDVKVTSEILSVWRTSTMTIRACKHDDCRWHQWFCKNLNSWNSMSDLILWSRYIFYRASLCHLFWISRLSVEYDWYTSSVWFELISTRFEDTF